MFAVSVDEIFVQKLCDGQLVYVFGFDGEWLRQFPVQGELIASTVSDFLWISRRFQPENHIVALGLDGQQIVHFVDPDPEVSCIAVGPHRSLLLAERGNILPRQRDYFNTRLALR